MRPLRASLACALLLVLVPAPSALADHGDAKRKITRVDQARARAMLLRQSDFSEAFTATRPAPDPSHSYCNAIDESDLTISGDAESREFAAGLLFVSSFAQVYVSERDSLTSWRRGIRPAGRRCAREIFRADARQNGVTFNSFGTTSFPRLARQSIAFRIVLTTSEGVRIYVDAVLMRHGRAQAAVVLGSGLAPVPKAERLRYARLVAGRMARALRGA